MTARIIHAFPSGYATLLNTRELAMTSPYPPFVLHGVRLSAAVLETQHFFVRSSCLSHDAKLRAMSIIILIILLSASSSFGQHPESDNQVDRSSVVTLDSILERLQTNIDRYRRSVPDLFCEEHVQSRIQGRMSSKKTETDSSFRLRRTTDPKGQIRFEESRIIQKVNGIPVTGEVSALSGPAVLYGAFSDALREVSTSGKACFQYHLHRAYAQHADDQLVISFESLPARKRRASCPLSKSYGTAYVDPASMQVVRLDTTNPDKELLSGTPGTWKWSIEYAPVTLIGEAVWMPEKINSISSAHDSSYTWTFQAAYTNYHRFHVDSVIIPGSPVAP